MHNGGITKGEIGDKQTIILEGEGWTNIKNDHISTRQKKWCSSA